MADRDLTFINRGISGNTVLDLAKRWQQDALDLKPDILSILIGVNDKGKCVPMDQYEQVYDKLLTGHQGREPKGQARAVLAGEGIAGVASRCITCPVAPPNSKCPTDNRSLTI